MLQKADVAEVLAAEGHRGQSRTVVMAVLAGVAVVIVLGAAAAWAWSAWRAGSPENYLTEAVSRGDITVTLVATGTLQPTRKVSVASLSTGTVASVDVDYNQAVTKGQALAHLDMSDLEPRLRRALAMVDLQEASRTAAATALADAQAALARANGLTSGETVSRREVEAAQTAAQRAQANLAAADAQLKATGEDLAVAKSDYAKGTITSPIDGVVLDMNVNVGDTLTTTALVTSLFTIAGDLKTLDLEADVDEADVAQVKVGDKVSFTVESAPDRPFPGVIRQVRVGPAITDGVVSYKALISVDNAALQLKPGMTATADVAVDGAHDVLTVPNAALRFSPAASKTTAGMFGRQSTAQIPSGGDQHVYVLRDGKPQLVEVGIGLTDGQRTEITGGALGETDVVITGTKAK